MRSNPVGGAEPIKNNSGPSEYPEPSEYPQPSEFPSEQPPAAEPGMMFYFESINKS
jgi:hypothetical protein